MNDMCKAVLQWVPFTTQSGLTLYQTIHFTSVKNVSGMDEQHTKTAVTGQT
jgi:hypothetical protein